MWIIYLNCNFFQHTNYSLYCICFIILLSIEKLCGLEPQHTPQPVKDTTSSGNNTPRTNQRDRRYSNRGRSNNQGNRRHKQPASIVTPSSFRWYPSRSSSLDLGVPLYDMLLLSHNNMFLIFLQIF
jgi:hypothetical protein